jgi:capsular polysaccharide transport system permease protein
MDSTVDRQAGGTRPTTPAPAPAAPAFFDAVKSWSTIMTFLVAEQLNRRTKAGRLGLLLTIAEPFLLICSFYWIHTVLRGVIQQYGDSVFLFLASGLLPFYFFMRTSTTTRRDQQNVGRSLPRISSLDIFMASVAAQTMIWIPVIGAVFAGMWVYGIAQARPASIADCAAALLFLGMLGAGYGLINSVIGRFMPVWPRIMALATRGAIFVSGVIHIPDFYAPSIRPWLAWNPILHGVDWFRLGLYGRYPTLLLDQSYLVKSAIVLLFIGVVVDRATLRYGLGRK